MIKENRPQSMAETKEILSQIDTDKAKEVAIFIKKFVKLSVEKEKSFKNDLKELGLLKLREEHIIRIIDFLPQDADDIRKICLDVNLDQNEISQIIEVVKKYS